MQRDDRSPTPQPAQVSDPQPPAETRPEPRFERPRMRRLGALPAVTTAFGGSFTP